MSKQTHPIRHQHYLLGALCLFLVVGCAFIWMKRQKQSPYMGQWIGHYKADKLTLTLNRDGACSFGTGKGDIKDLGCQYKIEGNQIILVSKYSTTFNDESYTQIVRDHILPDDSGRIMRVVSSEVEVVNNRTNQSWKPIKGHNGFVLRWSTGQQE